MLNDKIKTKKPIKNPVWLIILIWLLTIILSGGLITILTDPLKFILILGITYAILVLSYDFIKKTKR